MFKLNVRPLFALTAGLVVGAVLSSFSISADAGDDFGSVPRTSPSPTPAINYDEYRDAGDFGMSDVSPSPKLDQEISPEEFAAEYGLPETDDQPFGEDFGFSKSVPQTRVVSPERFGDFRVNVDIFRKSTKRPILGTFRDEYTATLVPNADGMSEAARTAEAKKRFEILAGKEFAVASLDGVPFKAYIISGAIEAKVAMIRKDAAGNVIYNPSTGRPVTYLSMKTTPAGNYRLDPLFVEKRMKLASGKTKVVPVAYPWIRSRTYNNSQMFWGLWIKGGYFIHSTPHYYELGRPASMGCIRQSFPDAQELFKLVVEDKLPSMIRIHSLGSKSAVSRLREIVLDLGYSAPADAPVGESPRDPSKDMNWVLSQLAENNQRILDAKKYFGNDVNKVGHGWIDGETSETRKPADVMWPSCGDLENSPIDCFKTYGVKKPKNSLN